MKAHIYQIDLELDDKHICFMPYEAIFREYGDHFPDEKYALVYSLETDEKDPESIFALLNLHLPADYTARSLSVSDVVVYEHDDGSRTAYFCDTVGFVRIPFELNKSAIPF